MSWLKGGSLQWVKHYMLFKKVLLLKKREENMSNRDRVIRKKNRLNNFPWDIKQVVFRLWTHLNTRPPFEKVLSIFWKISKFLPILIDFYWVTIKFVLQRSNFCYFFFLTDGTQWETKWNRIFRAEIKGAFEATKRPKFVVFNH